ncbi:helix-turn-helix domain-containing protein [Sinorhizobium meliloti]|uniref:helix-turn-helix domain-containing protein n=1 Tax=Rhizobium meliloti TaxID=382 RepID=UPI000FD9A52A|nr:helix-turn-helix transcriptional regulator [Sinorhizobium meliloti]RVP99671.1 XRE family transcriptional regulator [Sinorhizobium meliloti]
MSDDIDSLGFRAALSIFGGMVQRQRQASRWTFLDMYEKTGIEIPALSALEQGRAALPEADMERISEFLGLGPDRFTKLLRSERIKAANGAAESSGGQRETVVDIARYREPWQETTSQPKD